RAILKQPAEMLAQCDAAVIALVQPCIAASIRTVQQVACVQRACPLESSDEVWTWIRAHAPHQRQKLLGIAVHHTWIEAKHAVVKGHSIAVGRVGYLLKLAPQAVTELPKTMRRVLGHLVLRPQGFHDFVARNALRRLARQEQEEFPRLRIATPATRPYLLAGAER